MQQLETDGEYRAVTDKGTETFSYWKATGWDGETVRFMTKEAAQWWLKLDNDHKEWVERKNEDRHQRTIRSDKVKPAFRRI